MKKVDIAVKNLMDNPELRPDNTKVLFNELMRIKPAYEQIEQSINQTNQTLVRLQDDRFKLSGSFETVINLIVASLMEETIEKYGKEILNVDKSKETEK